MKKTISLMVATMLAVSGTAFADDSEHSVQSVTSTNTLSSTVTSNLQQTQSQSQTANGGSGGAGGSVNNSVSNTAAGGTGGAGGSVNNSGNSTATGGTGGSAAANSGGNTMTSVYEQVRQAPGVAQGSFAISGCGVAGNAGGSDIHGSAFLGFGWTPDECYLFMQAQAYQSTGHSQAACEVLNHTKAAKRLVKDGFKLPECTPAHPPIIIMNAH